MQRQLPLGFVLDTNYVHREGRNLQREINLNQLLPGTVQANPGINSAALRPYLGYGVIRQWIELRQLALQQPPDWRRSPLQERVQVRRGLHAQPLDRQRE